jgi:hypothetical protein
VVQQQATEFNSWSLDAASLKPFHKFIFRFWPKDASLQQEAIPKEDAVRLIHGILDNKWALETYFCDYVAHRYPKRYMTVDQWDMLIDFALAFRYEVNLLQYEGQATSAWPMLMDAFIEDILQTLQQPDCDGSISALSQQSAMMR